MKKKAPKKRVTKKAKRVFLACPGCGAHSFNHVHTTDDDRVERDELECTECKTRIHHGVLAFVYDDGRRAGENRIVAELHRLLRLPTWTTTMNRAGTMTYVIHPSSDA